MDLKNITKQIVDGVLKESDLDQVIEAGPVSGDKAAANIAKAQTGLEKAKKRLQSLNIYEIPELKSTNTIDQLAIEPFGFDFLLQVKDDPQGLSLPTPYTFTTLARVSKKDPLTLEIKWDDLIFEMTFTNKNELLTQLPGTKDSRFARKKTNKVMALVSEGDSKDGKFYTIESPTASLKKVIEKTKEKEGEEVSGEEKEGQSGENEQGKEKQGGKVNKAQLFDDLAGFFKFTYNNRKLVSPKNFGESYDKIADNLILEDNDKNPINVENSIGKIYVKKITLGPKAEERKKESYSQSTQSQQTNTKKWDGNPINLPKAQAGKLPGSMLVDLNIELADESGLTPEQKTIFNELKGSLGAAVYNKEAEIRRSVASDETVIITLPNKKAIVCKIPKGTTNLKNITTVEVSPKAGGNDKLNKTIQAKIQVK